MSIFSIQNLMIFSGILYLSPLLFAAIAPRFFDINSVRLYVWRVPVISGLALCTWDNFGDVLKEISIKIFLSSWPILVSIGIFKFLKSNNLEKSIELSLNDGQLYLFCGSMLSSILFVAINNKKSTTSDDVRDKHVFPNQMSHLLIVYVLMGVSAFIYAFKKVDFYFSPEVMINFSYFYIVFVIGLNIVSSTISKALNSPNAFEFMKYSTKSFSDGYKPGKNS